MVDRKSLSEQIDDHTEWVEDTKPLLDNCKELDKENKLLTAKVEKLEKALRLSKEKFKKLRDSYSMNVGVHNFCIKALDEIEALQESEEK